jgi:hypothetical protein
MGGRRAGRARTAVDLAVPRWPRINTPPMVGSTAVRRMARFISSCPTIAEKGKGIRTRGSSGGMVFYIVGISRECRNMLTTYFVAVY